MLEALVTGATGNLGRALVAELESREWLVKRLSRQGQQQSIALDLTRWWATDYVVRHMAEAKFDLVVFAHGTTRIKPVVDYTDEDYRYVLDTNLEGSIAMTHHLLQYERLKPGALLVYISSIHAASPRAGRGLYAASKAGLEAFALTVAQEEHDSGYRSVALRLGQCDTMMQQVTNDPRERAYMSSRLLTPLLKPTDVAKFIVSLYQQPGLTGQILTLDGGQGHNVW